MDDPNEENIESNWVVINPVDIAEEATVLDYGKYLDESQAAKNQDSLESDMESDGISIISESSHLHEGSNEDENLSNIEDVIHDVEIGDHSKDYAVNKSASGKINWTFVDSEPHSPDIATSNQFYLNCLQEPVQELSEHELGSVQSDLDSDGISIISDCESLNEFTEDDKKLIEGVLSKDNSDGEDTTVASKFPSGIKKYCNGVLIGTILLATSSIFLGHYFNSVEQSEEDLPIYKEEYSSDMKEKVPEKINDFKDKYEVPSALAYCQDLHKGDDIFVEHNVKKCLNKIERRIKKKKERNLKEEEIKKLHKYLKIKEKYLEEKEKFLIKREYELLKAEMKLKNKHLKKIKKSEDNQNMNKVHKDKDESLKNSKGEFNKTPVINIIKKDKYKELDTESKYKKLIKTHKEKQKHLRKYEREKKLQLKKEWDSNNIKKNHGEKNVKTKSIIEEEAKLSSKTFKDTKPSTKPRDDLNFDDNNGRKYEKVKDKRNKGSTNYIILGNKNNETVNGYWVGRLYKGRSDMRNKGHTGDWYFDRASYRKAKRDKAKWYFDWMMDRELLRYRRSFYM